MDNHLCENLHQASRNGHTECITTLLSNHGANINEKDHHHGLSPLYMALAYGMVDAVQLLLDYGADVNVKDRYGWTPLHDAVSIRDYECIRILLDSGADLNITDSEDRTPFDMANEETKNFINGYPEIKEPEKN
jgi:ankyrin repeat protein